MAEAVDQSPVELKNIRIEYDKSVAVERVNIHIESGEFFTLLGPSGCGKTTLLRAIAGFNRQTSGDILIGRETVNDLPPYGRDTAMVFQNYAIFPHLNVWDNVSYGLKSRGVPKSQIGDRVREALSMVDLSGYEQRMPKQLSGGQQQRVVIARAIVVQPRVLLMDEPLANLDAKLRVRLREDLKALQQRLGITTVYVTHDQEEALSISDRIAVMSKGEVLQIGTPEQVYGAPEHIAVARFVGEGTFIRATKDPGSASSVRLANGRPIHVAPNDMANGNVWVSIRPEDVELAAPDEEATFEGEVVARSYFGPFIQLNVDSGVGDPVLARVPVTPVSRALGVGDRVGLHVDPQRIAVFPGDEELEV